ncbi:MAG: site-specific integrase [Candidatus Thiodiazotropha sp. (ex Troendleina suluensis)]|nr:site-specific integrase [Candidatus Thiodiazotropha sp. (ex Troendleina suluensis)]
MTKLREQMIDEMTVRGFSPRTHQSYLMAVRDLARHTHQPPDQLSVDQLQAYFLYLVKERGLSEASCRLYLNAIRFFYLQVLKRSAFEVTLQVPKRKQRIPELLRRTEIQRIIQACANLKHQTLLLTCYGCGLRVSELVKLKLRHIDSERGLLRIEQGKGAKDRHVILLPALLTRLRSYWRTQRSDVWLFPNDQRPNEPLSICTPQKVFRRAKQQAGIGKMGGIHSLRHAYATHQLQAGMPVQQLQYQLGHRSIQSTLRYVHWVFSDSQRDQGGADLISALALSDE